MDALIGVFAEAVFTLAGEVLVGLVIRPIGRALRSAYGFLVLLGLWIAAGYMGELGCRMGMSGDGGLRTTIGIFLVAGTPFFGIASTLIWMRGVERSAPERDRFSSRRTE